MKNESEYPKFTRGGFLTLKDQIESEHGKRGLFEYINPLSWFDNDSMHSAIFNLMDKSQVVGMRRCCRAFRRLHWEISRLLGRRSYIQVTPRSVTLYRGADDIVFFEPIEVGPCIDCVAKQLAETKNAVIEITRKYKLQNTQLILLIIATGSFDPVRLADMVIYLDPGFVMIDVPGSLDYCVNQAAYICLRDDMRRFASEFSGRGYSARQTPASEVTDVWIKESLLSECAVENEVKFSAALRQNNMETNNAN